MTATKERTRERYHDQQDRKTTQKQQQQVMQRAPANRTLRYLADKNKSRELDFTRTCASHEMHENGRRERRDAEKK